MKFSILTLTILSASTLFVSTKTILPDIESYNQKELYVKYDIDTIVKQIIKEGTFTDFTLLDRKGRKTKSYSYCENGNISYETIYDSLENEIKSTTYFCDIKYKIESLRLSEYNNDGKLLKYSHSEDFNIYNTTSENVYDEQKRLKEYRYYSFSGQLNWKEVYSYESGQRIKLRMKGDGKIIYKEITKFDNQGREIESEYYYGGQLKSKYLTEYDQFGNKKRYAGYFYPGQKLDNESIRYYSSLDKLDSTKSMCCENKNVYNLTTFQYDARGFLIKEVFQDNRNNADNSVTTYSYF